ncbi:MAG: DNA polymerase I [Chlamydiae bacterium]|nr:DNA polymerase I [Chlamydiota bacterium]
MKPKLFVLDVSGFIFRAYYALPPMTSPKGEATHALFGFIRSVLKLFKDFSPEHIVAVFDGPDNKRQRTAIYEQYKANRTQIAEDLPEQIEKGMDFCKLLGVEHLAVPGVEADDTMGSIAKWGAGQGWEVYLCTSDKDLAQLVTDEVFLLNPWKENLVIDAAKVEEIYGVPPAQIIDLLAIMGDSSDNIPGLKGFGPKTAVALLKEFGSLETLLANPEKVKGQKKQETLKEEAEIARLSQRLATIHTDVDFPKEKGVFSKRPTDLPSLRQFYLDFDFTSLVKELGGDFSQEEGKVDYHLVDDEEALDQLIETLQNQKEIAFDTETTHVRPLLAELVGIGFSFREKEGYYIPLNGKLGKERVLEAITPLFANREIGFFAHNAKYDLHILANYGIKVANLCFDTILASYLLNSGTRRHSLDALSLQYFGKVKTPIKDLIGSGKKEITMDQVPIEKVSSYCSEDVDYTFRLKQVLAKPLEERGLAPLLFDLELPLTRILAKMERAGVYLNVEELKEYAVEINKELRGREKEIYELAGEEFNISSPKQLSHILFEKMGIKPLKKTATGLSTRAEVLEALALKYPIAEKILSFRSLEKLRSTYIESLPNEVNPETKRVHPTYNQFVTATGRLACQDPNLQNIPVRTPQGRRIREAFRPQKDGWSYLAADYSQIELRLMAHLSGDPSLIEAFQKGEDIHTSTASLMFEIPLEKVTKEQRHHAKAINFGILYGQQAYGLSQELKIPIDKAATFIKNYFLRYPKVGEFIDQTIREAKESGKSVTILGREREMPDILSSNAIVRNAAERLAINTPLQGTAADLIKEAMLRIDCEMEKRKLKSLMILQIHDELIFEVPDEEIDTLLPLVKQAMEGVYTLKVPLVVDVAIGKNWAEC